MLHTYTYIYIYIYIYIYKASPIDRIWVLAYHEMTPELDRSKWRGTNWLGEILTEVSEELLNSDLKGKMNNKNVFLYTDKLFMCYTP